MRKKQTNNKNNISDYKVVKFTDHTFEKHKEYLIEFGKCATSEIFYNIEPQHNVTNGENFEKIYLMHLDEVVGFCSFSNTTPSYLHSSCMSNIYIKQIFISHKYRKKGLSSLLIEAVIKEAVLKSFDFISVEFIDLEYGNAISKKYNFEYMGKTPNYKIAHKINYMYKYILFIDQHICDKYHKHNIEWI